MSVRIGPSVPNQSPWWNWTARQAENLRRSEKETWDGLTHDHVGARVRGGKTVLGEHRHLLSTPATIAKGARTPDEAGMKLLRKPFKPTSLPLAPMSFPSYDGEAERQRRRLEGLPEKLHAGLVGRAAPFAIVAGVAGGDDVLPDGLAAANAGHDVVVVEPSSPSERRRFSACRVCQFHHGDAVPTVRFERTLCTF